MGTIEILGLEFFGHHGLYEEEKQNGNTFIVDIKVKTDLSVASKTDAIHDTVDYVTLFKIAENIMNSKSSNLLEKISNNILDGIYNEYPNIYFAEVTVAKINPPVGGRCMAARVTVNRTNEPQFTKR